LIEVWIQLSDVVSRLMCIRSSLWTWRCQTTQQCWLRHLLTYLLTYLLT